MEGDPYDPYEDDPDAIEGGLSLKELKELAEGENLVITIHEPSSKRAITVLPGDKGNVRLEETSEPTKFLVRESGSIFEMVDATDKASGFVLCEESGAVFLREDRKHDDDWRIHACMDIRWQDDQDKPFYGALTIRAPLSYSALVLDRNCLIYRDDEEPTPWIFRAEKTEVIIPTGIIDGQAMREREAESSELHDTYFEQALKEGPVTKTEMELTSLPVAAEAV